ncbi:MAG: cupin domain-containing protein [Bacteroidetes bacterium]|nr:cupin domain-containing protein [Bacteroidota bacterium]
MNQDEVARAWADRGFSCGLWQDPPGQVWQDYVHDADELFMLVEGRMELEIAGVVHVPVRGDEILIPAGAVHTVRTLGVSGSRWLYGYRRPAPKPLN